MYSASIFRDRQVGPFLTSSVTGEIYLQVRKDLINPTLIDI